MAKKNAKLKIKLFVLPKDMEAFDDTKRVYASNQQKFFSFLGTNSHLSNEEIFNKRCFYWRQYTNSNEYQTFFSLATPIIAIRHLQLYYIPKAMKKLEDVNILVTALPSLIEKVKLYEDNQEFIRSFLKTCSKEEIRCINLAEEIATICEPEKHFGHIIGIGSQICDVLLSIPNHLKVERA